MKRIAALSGILILACALPALATAAAPTAAHPKVVVHAGGSASSDSIALGDIAEITPSPKTCKASARLAATVIGCAPLEGASRTLTRGDICLKLRQAGIDPSSIDLEGAENIVVTAGSGGPAQPASTVGTTSTTVTLLPQTSAAQQVRPSGPVVHAGDPVDVVLVDGPVTVHAKGFAVTSGGVGDTVSVRRDDAPHPLSATIIGAGQVELEE